MFESLVQVFWAFLTAALTVALMDQDEPRYPGAPVRWEEEDAIPSAQDR